MKPALQLVGETRSPVIVIDGFAGDAERIARLADELAPFPRDAKSHYPGVRRVIDEKDKAFEYVERACEAVADFVGGTFEVETFNLLWASFSIVSLRPDELSPRQRAPHVDSTDSKFFAMLHYLRVPEGSGTAFYRQRSTGIERVTQENFDRFTAAAEADLSQLRDDSGYIMEDGFYEQIGAIEAVPDRLLIYNGNLLHSSIIPPGMEFSSDPSTGRLTANLFLQGT